MSKAMEAFEEFWPFYLQQHSSEGSRLLHFFGTGMVFPLIAAAAFTQEHRLLIIALLVAYASAWIGHAVFEKNRPATFSHPLWSLRADFRMFRLWLFGTLDSELTSAGVLTR